MPTISLTDRFVASKKRPSKRLTYFDTLARGLALRVTPAGAKAWYFTYRVAGSPTEWLRLGEYDTLGLAAARTLAATYRYQVDVEQRNPAAEKRTPPPPPEPEAPVMTFATFVPVYVAFAKGKKRTWSDDARKIDTYLLPAWGPLPLTEIKRKHVHELLDSLMAKGLTVGVNRIQALISRLFTVALDRSLIDAHPAARMIDALLLVGHELHGFVGLVVLRVRLASSRAAGSPAALSPNPDDPDNNDQDCADEDRDLPLRVHSCAMEIL